MTIRHLAFGCAMLGALTLAASGVSAAETEGAVSGAGHTTHHDEAAPGGNSSGAGSDDPAMQGSGMMMCQPMMSMMGDGMMQGGKTGHGKMGGGMMQGGMMGHGMMGAGKGAMGPGTDRMAHEGLHRLLSADEVTERLKAMIADHKRLKVAKVEPGGDFSFAAEITTVDGSLVQKLLVDRRNGMTWDAE